MGGGGVGWYAGVDPRDTEETPDMYGPAESKQAAVPEPVVQEPQFGVVPKENARACYLCGYASVEFAKYPKYGLYMHWGCWSVYGHSSRKVG
jgi:hypothetical protein